VKRCRRVGERRARRAREHTARQAEAEAKEDNVLQRFADLDASVAAELAAATVMNRFLENAERVADRDAADADTAMQQVVERLRARQLSKKQLAVLARVIAAELGQAELAIRDARAACESSGREVEDWTRSVATAVQHERNDLADEARGRVEQSRSNVKLTDSVLREYLELRDRLRHLGRVLLEIAEG
jgi:hypothetical protein